LNSSGARSSVVRFGATADLEALSRVIPTMAAYRVYIERRPIPSEYIASLIDGILLVALRMPDRD
jgi:hypothetical protein